MKPSEIKVGVWYEGDGWVASEPGLWARIVVGIGDGVVAYWCQDCEPGNGGDGEGDGHEARLDDFAAWAVRPVPAPRPAEEECGRG